MSRFSRNLAGSISTDRTDVTDCMETQVADSTGAERSSDTVTMKREEEAKGAMGWMRGLMSRASRGGVSPAEGGNRYPAVTPDSSLAIAGTVQTYAVSGAKRLSRIGRATALSMSLGIMMIVMMMLAMAANAFAAPVWGIDSMSNTTVAPGGQVSTTL